MKKDRTVVGCISLIIAMICTGVSIYFFSRIYLKKNQIYTDIISELSMSNQNKSGELFSVWISFLLGFLIFIGMYFYLSKKTVNLSKYISKIRFKRENLEYIVPLVTLMIMFFFGKNDARLLTMFMLYIGFNVLSSILEKDVLWKYKVVFIMYLLYMNFYSFMSLLNVLDINRHQLMISFILIVFYVTSITLLGEKNINTDFFLYYIAALQVPIPMLLFNLCMHRYNYNGEIIIDISLGIPYYILILGFALSLFCINIKGFKEVCIYKSTNWLFLGTVISLSVFYINYDISLLNSGDLWHPGEQLLPWQQIIEKGLAAYVDYDPASGLYPMIVGFFNEIILGGYALTYNIAESLFRVMFAIVLICSIYKIDKKTSLLVAIFIPMTYYTRPLIFIPVYFALSNEKLIQKRAYWILVWVLSSFVAGLYYPLNGVAIMLGALPFAIVQFDMFIKQKEYRQCKNDIKLYIFALAEIIIILFSVKTLFYMFLHITSLSGQSVTADGMLAFGRSNPPAWFLSYITKESIRREAYAIFTFALPIMVCFVFMLVFILFVFSEDWKKKLTTRLFFLISFPIVVLIISYTFTFIRIDPNTILARSAPTIVVALTFLIVIMKECQKAGYGKGVTNVFIGLAFGFIFLVQDYNIGNEKRFVIKEMYIGDGYQYVNGDELGLPRLGEGFIINDTYNRIVDIKNNLDELMDVDESFLDMTFSQELYYIFDVKVPVNDPGTYVVSSYDASKENMRDIKENKPPIVIWGDTWYGRGAVRNYYMFRELIDLGYVLYTNNNCDFLISHEKYVQLWGEDAYNAALEDMILNSSVDEFAPVNLQGTPAAWGNSFSTLENRFEKIEDLDEADSWCYMMHLDNSRWIVDDGADPFVFISIDEIEGQSADFLFLDLDVHKKRKADAQVTIFWETDNESVNENRCYQFQLDEGRLLIPVGIHPGWSKENITALRIDFDGLDAGDSIKINSADFLKLNADQ